MFILKDKTQLERAIAKALKIRPRVEFDYFGRYRVSARKAITQLFAAKMSAVIKP